ncbi:hypothetical protein PRK78_007038 [Emydomyces testavorans]|uniref:DUF1740-domain-containing protein n=1 Tax=Emydomyces testavorans TaxID=2070801 RepID=A0AAF0DNB7_9EURO|nr:hypothetical protein PRK78_007038 [Emydomyces testavorans]
MGEKKLRFNAKMESGEAKGKQAIPKFASFKPKAQPDVRAHETRETRRDVSRDRELSSVRHETKSTYNEEYGVPRKSKDRDQRVSSAVYEKERRGHEPLRSAERKGPEQYESDHFKIDKRGDKYNVEYGAPHRYGIPLYHRIGAGRVLGLQNDVTIDRELSLGNKIVMHSRSSYGGPDSAKQRYSTSAWKRASKVKEFRRVRPADQTQGNSEFQQNFIPLTSNGSKKRRRIDRRVSPDENFVPDYRSIEGKAKPTYKSAFDADLTSDSDLESEGETARRQNAMLSARVSAHPDDIDGWLDLINHQGSLVGALDSEGHRIYTSAEKRSIADIKISMYERALGEIPDSAPRDRLLLGMMQEGATIWDTKVLSDKWKNVLRSNSGYITLWVKYLEFQQTRFSTFTYENCRSIFLECLSISQTQPDTFKRNVIALYVLLRLSLFMREAGFCEHAVALWQAILEFNFCAGELLQANKTFSNAVQSFCEFWDSEVPRLGEAGAKGWDTAGDGPPAAKSDPPLEDVDRKAIFESWIKLEQYLMHHSCLPARMLDEVQEDDPYRVMLSSDISDILIFFPEDLLDLLLNAFLLFCHLPPIVSVQNYDVLAEWCEDPFIRNVILDQANISSQWFKTVPKDPGDLDLPPPTSFPYPNFPVNEDTLFGDGSSWFSAFESWKASYVDCIGSLDAPWVRRTLRQLVDRCPSNDALAEYSVSLEYTCNPNDATKYVKSLLRKRPSSIRLYNAYALIESRRNQEPTAEKAWMTTLSMSESFSEEIRRNCVLLWRSWLWDALRKDNACKATRLLLAIPENAVDVDKLPREAEQTTCVSPAEFLKVQRVLVEAQEYGLSFRNPTVFINNTDCLALLLYLTRNLDIESALSVYRTAENRLQSNNLEKTYLSELLHQSKARLLWHHISSTTKYKPALIREELSSSLTLFPHNTIFLSLFAYNESRFRIDDRVRIVLRQHISGPAHRGSETITDVLGHSILTPHFFSIYSELHRGVSAGSTAHSARAAFETAVSSRSGQCSAALWKLYILFNLNLGDKQRARDVFYRSIRSCPWAKELILLAFKEPELREYLGSDELRKIWHVLVEKGLRVHVDLEEVLEEMDINNEKGRHTPVMPHDKTSDDEM